MSFLVEFFVETVLGGIWEAFRRHPAPDACTRCGRNSGLVPAAGGPSHLLVCLPCAAAVARNLRAAGWFFLGLGILFGCMFMIILYSDSARGRPTDWIMVVMLGLTALLCMLGVAIKGAATRRVPPAPAPQ